MIDFAPTCNYSACCPSQHVVTSKQHPNDRDTQRRCMDSMHYYDSSREEILYDYEIKCISLARLEFGLQIHRNFDSSGNLRM